MPGADVGVPYAVLAADHAAGRFASAEELHALEVALDLIGPDDERSPALHERAARAAILRGPPRQTATEHARLAIEGRARLEGPRVAVATAIRLGRLADRVEVFSGIDFAQLAEPYADAVDEDSPDGVELLAWRVLDGEHRDPNNPGIAVDSPDRRRLNELAERLEPAQRPDTYLYPSAQAVVDASGRGATGLLWRLVFGGPGRYREAAEMIRPSATRLVAGGDFSRAVFMLGLLARIHLAFGELDVFGDLRAEGDALLPRLEPGSNATFTFEWLEALRAQLVDLDYRPSYTIAQRMLAAADRRDVHWVRGANRLWLAWYELELGLVEPTTRAVAENLPVIERAALGAPNLAGAIHGAVRILWFTGRADHAEVLEQNLHRQVIEPDFCNPLSDARWNVALLCALTGRADEARMWFQRGRDKLLSQEAVVHLSELCCDEALMELRLGPAGDRANGLRRLDEARRWADRIGLPAHLPRIDALAAQLSG
jgi:hypothetical protein